MSLLSKVQRGRTPRPLRLLVYSTPGTGKSAFGMFVSWIVLGVASLATLDGDALPAIGFVLSNPSKDSARLDDADQVMKHSAELRGELHEPLSLGQCNGVPGRQLTPQNFFILDLQVLDLAGELRMRSRGSVSRSEIKKVATEVLVEDVPLERIRLGLRDFTHRGTDYEQSKAASVNRTLGLLRIAYPRYARIQDSFVRLDIVDPEDVWGR